jgi:hypothetical protein
MAAHQPVGRQIGVIGHDRHLVDPPGHLPQEATLGSRRVVDLPQDRGRDPQQTVHQLELLPTRPIAVHHGALAKQGDLDGARTGMTTIFPVCI